MVIHIKYKFHEIPFSGYIVEAPDGRNDGHGQTYIPPPSAGDKKTIAFFSGGKNYCMYGEKFPYLSRLSRRLYLPICIRKFCHAINSTTLEKMLLKYAAFRGRTLFGFLIKEKRLETSKRTF